MYTQDLKKYILAKSGPKKGFCREFIAIPRIPRPRMS